jgi:hypothetical protein
VIWNAGTSTDAYMCAFLLRLARASWVRYLGSHRWVHALEGQFLEVDAIHQPLSVRKDLELYCECKNGRIQPSRRLSDTTDTYFPRILGGFAKPRPHTGGFARRPLGPSVSPVLGFGRHLKVIIHQRRRFFRMPWAAHGAGERERNDTHRQPSFQ